MFTNDNGILGGSKGCSSILYSKLEFACCERALRKREGDFSVVPEMLRHL